MTKKMTIGGRRVKCQCCRRTARTLIVDKTPICNHCFKAYALGLLIGRAMASGNPWEKHFKDKSKEEEE